MSLRYLLTNKKGYLTANLDTMTADKIPIELRQVNNKVMRLQKLELLQMLNKEEKKTRVVRKACF